jgi:hypothetical protein
LRQKGIATMADDARISTALPRHPKTVKLQRRLGAPGFCSLICLFLWVAENRPTGDLEGMSDEDIEIAATWPGESETFVRTLTEVGFLDGAKGAYRVHDWAEHNPWAANRPRRVEKARAAAGARWESKHSAIEKSEPSAASMHGACSEHVLAMPTSPHLTTPPDTTAPPLSEKSVAVHSKEKSYSQADFDARDLRKLALARDELQLKLGNGWGTNLTATEIWEHQCALAGVSPQQADEVMERTKKRPQGRMLVASA